MIELTLRIVFSLLVVLGLMWGLARMARRPLGTRRGGLIDVLGRQQLSRGASVAVVRVVDKVVVLGVTDNQITLLADTDPDRVEELRHEPQEHRESLSLDALTGETVGHGNRTAPVVSPNGPLAGSILSTQTWSQTWQALRERRRRNP